MHVFCACNVHVYACICAIISICVIACVYAHVRFRGVRVCMYARMYVRVCVCLVFMYVCMYARMCV